MRILVVEDNPRISAFLRKGLGEEGYTVEVEGDGDRAFQRAAEERFDAAVVDVMLPGRDGVRLVRDLRDAGLRFPVLLLTARDRMEDKIAGSMPERTITSPSRSISRNSPPGSGRCCAAQGAVRRPIFRRAR